MKRVALGGLVLLAGLLLAGCGKELPTAQPWLGRLRPRVVLAELFTAVWCGNCPYAEGALERAVRAKRRARPGGTPRLVVIDWHPSYGQGDPFAIPASDDRMDGLQGHLRYADRSADGDLQRSHRHLQRHGGDLRASTARSSTLYAGLPSPMQLSLSLQDDGDHVHPLIQILADLHASIRRRSRSPRFWSRIACRTRAAWASTCSASSRAPPQSQTVSLEGTEPASALLTLPVASGLDATEPLRDRLRPGDRGRSPGRDYREVLQAAVVPLVAGDANSTSALERARNRHRRPDRWRAEDPVRDPQHRHAGRHAHRRSAGRAQPTSRPTGRCD